MRARARVCADIRARGTAAQNGARTFAGVRPMSSSASAHFLMFGAVWRCDATAHLAAGWGVRGRANVTVFDCVKFRAKIFVPNQSDISRPGTVIDALPGEPCYIIDTILRYRVINTLPGT